MKEIKKFNKELQTNYTSKMTSLTVGEFEMREIKEEPIDSLSEDLLSSAANLPHCVASRHFVDMGVIIKDEDDHGTGTEEKLGSAKDEGEESPFTSKIECLEGSKLDSYPVIVPEATTVKLENMISFTENSPSRLMPGEEVTVKNEPESEGEEVAETNDFSEMSFSCTTEEDKEREIKKEFIDSSSEALTSPATSTSFCFNGRHFLDTSVIMMKEEDLGVDTQDDPGSAEDHFYSFTAIKKEEAPLTQVTVKTQCHETFSCKRCSARFKTAESLKEHVLVCEKSFFCPLCWSKFRSKRFLKLHLPAHFRKRPFYCPQCYFGFVSKLSLIEHLANHFDVLKSFSCLYCGAKFKTKTLLKKHLPTHSDERPYPCSYCTAFFKSPSALTQHLKVHPDSKPYVCLHCFAEFRVKFDLKKHLATHSDEQPISCQYCPTKVKTQSDLEDHLTSHSDERPLDCPECLAKFKDESTLRRHAAFHRNQ